jgi:hypothetical protein
VTQTEERRLGDWLQTYTGRAFWPLDPDPAEIDIIDIAHALSMLCRYGGHAREFYSVAQHSVLMSWKVAPENALWALLHDASEGYLVDLPRPLKHFLPDYKRFERRLMIAICLRFGLDLTEPDEVKAADNRILVDERAVLLGEPPLPWHSVENVDPLGVEIQPWAPVVAKEKFLARFTALGGVA